MNIIFNAYDFLILPIIFVSFICDAPSDYNFIEFINFIWIYRIYTASKTSEHNVMG